MSSFTIGSDPRFRTGTELSVWLESATKPYGAVITTGTVGSDGTVTLTGLSDGVRYVAGVTVSGPFTYFQTTSAASEPGGTDGLGTYTKGVIVDIDGFGGIERPDASSVEWIQPEAPTIGEGATEARDGDTWIPSVVEE